MGNVPMTRSEEVLEIHETNYFHSSTFVELEDGRVLQVAGTTFSISENGGITWSEPFICQDRVGNLVGGGGTSLVKLSERGIGLAAIWKTTDQVEPKRPNTQGKNHLIFWRSKDEGETWEEPVQVTEPRNEYSCISGCNAAYLIRAYYNSSLCSCGTGNRPRGYGTSCIGKVDEWTVGVHRGSFF